MTLCQRLDRQPGRSPGLEPADDIGRPGKAKLLKRGCRKARAVPVGADQDHLSFRIGQLRIMVAGGGIQSPEQN